MKTIRQYSVLSRFKTIRERYEYLKIPGVVGKETFGFDRYLNQKFYKSKEWRDIRDSVIIRDNGCDLGIPGFEIHDRILIHHMNPVLIEDLKYKRMDILDPEFLITTCFSTHQAIHYGDESMLPQTPIIRRPGD